MKKEKRQILGSIASYVMAFVCITSWIALGVVLALASVNIGVNGSISFTASDVYADVTGTVTGTATTNTLDAIHFSASTTSFTTPSSWSNINFDFVKGQDIVFTINVANKSTERSLWVKFTDSISATNTNITRKSAGTIVTSFSTLEVPKSTTKSVEITLSIKDRNLSISGNFGLGLNLTSQEPAKDVSEYSTLSFSVDNTSKTADVSANDSNNPTGDVVIPSSVLYNGEEYIIDGIAASAFQNCSSLTSIIIPASVKSIENRAFYGCSALTSITIPEGVTSIGSSAFCNCSKLTSITIPEGVTKIGNSAFGNCSKLISITIPSSVTSIGTSAFSGCSVLASITIPAGLTSIGSSAFYYCSSLKSITIPSGVTVIGTNTFYACSSLTSITIPEGVTSIGLKAFSKCSKLTSVTFENTTGWKTGDTTLSSSDLANKSTAATLLVTTYSEANWTRS